MARGKEGGGLNSNSNKMKGTGHLVLQGEKDAHRGQGEGKGRRETAASVGGTIYIKKERRGNTTF